MKHAKHRYFFVKDKVDQGDIDIVHIPVDAPLPEDRIWADVLTMPKSGCPFLEDRSVLMNCPVNYVDNNEFDEASDKNKLEEFVFTKVGGSHIKVQRSPLSFTAGVCWQNSVSIGSFRTPYFSD